MPKLILLDLKMPNVNGIKVLRKIKSDERTKVIHVVVFSSSKEDKDIMMCYQLSVNSYIVKPVEFEAFVNAVPHLCSYWLLMNQFPH